MFQPNQITQYSKLLSFILRLKPREYEIVLDENSYINANEYYSYLMHF